MDKPTASAISTYRQVAANTLSMLERVPPQATDMEKAVLGAMMLRREAIYDVVDILKVESFYTPAHGAIYGAIKGLYENDKPVDLLTVAQALMGSQRLDEVGGAYYLTELTGKVSNTQNVQYHARIIEQKFVLRELIRISSEINSDAHDAEADPMPIVDSIGLKITELQVAVHDGGHISTAADHIQSLGDKDSKATFTSWGIPQIDSFCGLYHGRMHVVAARPGIGKSAVLAHTAWHHASEGRKCMLFSLEMPPEEWTARCMAIETGIPYGTILRKQMDEQQLSIYWQAFERVADLMQNIIIDDTGGITWGKMRARTERQLRKHPLAFVGVDYLQLMTTGDKHLDRQRIDRVSKCSNSVRDLAKEFNVPTIALSQFSREIEKRGDPRPFLSDLRESGEIEQDMSVGVLMYRLKQAGGVATPDTDVLYMDIAKHRGGSTGTVEVAYTLATNRIGFEVIPVPTREPVADPHDRDTNPF